MTVGAVRTIMPLAMGRAGVSSAQIRSRCLQQGSYLACSAVNVPRKPLVGLLGSWTPISTDSMFEVHLQPLVAPPSELSATLLD